MNIQHKEKAGSTAGAILLIAGCCIGAGMLGLPVVSALAGFQPSLLMFLFSWVFMTATALLLLEVNLWYAEEISMVSMADRTLGMTGKVISWSCFLFLFYALGVAYIAGCGELIASFFREITAINLPNWAGSLAVSVLFGICVYSGTEAVDLVNRILMTGLILSYFLLVFIGAPHVKSEYLDYKNWSAAPFVLPLMIISFGFHNLIPTLSTYLRWDSRRLRFAVICGSGLALLIYLIWEWLILGLAPPQPHESLHQILDKGEMATHFLKAAVGASWVVDASQYFAFFAIVTSFLGNSLSFVDFLADGFRLQKKKQSKAFLCLLVILPPFILSVFYPRIFLMALNYGGAFGAVTLFGILPALMVWSGRYSKKYEKTRIVPGGRFVLAAIILFAFWLISLQFTDLSLTP